MKYTIERADIEEDGTVELPEGAIFLSEYQRFIPDGKPSARIEVIKYLKPVNQAP